MAEKVTIDDSAKITVPNAPIVVYLPPASWRENAICDACNISKGPVMTRLTETASSGTWTGAAWEPRNKVLTATLDFQGSDIAADFILFYRSGDVKNSTGESNLRFAIDGVEKLNRRMVATDYAFQDDFVRQRMFSESNLDPNANHTLRIQWSHADVRPPITVALDSIEYYATPASGSSGTSGSSKSNIAKIVAPTVVAVVAVFALLGLLFRFFWLKRQRRRRNLRLIVDPDPPNHTSQMQPHVQSNWNATLWNRPGSTYLDQSFDSSPMSPVFSGTAATVGSVVPRAAHESALSPPPYADTDTGSSISHPIGEARLYPTPATKSSR